MHSSHGQFRITEEYSGGAFGEGSVKTRLWRSGMKILVVVTFLASLLLFLWEMLRRAFSNRKLHHMTFRGPVGFYFTLSSAF